MKLNHSIALLGGCSKLTDYWDAASLFEVNCVGGAYDLANEGNAEINAYIIIVTLTVVTVLTDVTIIAVVAVVFHVLLYSFNSTRWL